MKGKAKAEILEREYQRVVAELQSFKEVQHGHTTSSSTLMHTYIQGLHQSTAVGRGLSPGEREIGMSGRVSRTTGITPINKIYDDRVIEPIPEEPLVESKINRREKESSM